MSPHRSLPVLTLWHYVWKLLRLNWSISFSNFRHTRRRGQIGYVILVLILLAISAGAFLASTFILRSLRSPELAQWIEPGLLLSIIPSVIAAIAFIGTFSFSFGVLLQALYLAGDMDMLLTAPVPIRAVFLSKLVQAVLPNLGLALLFGLPVLFGLGTGNDWNPLYYPVVVIVLAGLVFAAAGLASLAVMSIVRVLPARSIAQVLALAGSAISLFCSQSRFLTRSASVSPDQVSRAFGYLTILDAPWSPFAWAGRGLMNIGQGEWLAGLGLVTLVLGLVGVTFAVTLTTAERLYYSGWARVQGGGHKTRAGRAPRPRIETVTSRLTLVERLVPAAVRGLMAKDARVLRRDLRNMSQFLSPLILGIFYAIFLIQGRGTFPAASDEAPTWVTQTIRGAIGYGNVGIALFVGFALMSRLGAISFSHEGKYYWMLKTAPVKANQLLTAKFLMTYLPTLILGWGFLIAISLLQHGDPAALLFNLPVVALCIAGGTGVSLAIGVVAVNLTWDDPRRMMPAGAGCQSVLAIAGALALSLALFFGPPVGGALLGWSASAGQLIGLGLGGIASLLCAFVPVLLVRDRVLHIGEG